MELAILGSQLRQLLVLCLLGSILGAALAACAPAPAPTVALPTLAPATHSPPTLPPPTRAPETSATPTLAPTIARATGAPPTPTTLPTRTPLPSLTATPTIPVFPTLSGATFNFDDGVPPDQRDLLVNAVAMARSYLGETKSYTVHAYANIDTLMAVEDKYFGWAPNNPSRANSLQAHEEGKPQSDRNTTFVYVNPRYSSLPVITRYGLLVHEYFHTQEAQLSNMRPQAGGAVPVWMYEGMADFAAKRVLAKYGLNDLDQVRGETVMRTRGILAPLNTMETMPLAEQEGFGSRYHLGYLAADLLTEKYGGEQAVLRTFWERIPQAGGWRPAFQSAYGLTPDEFYARFEAYRQAEFPPWCGPVGTPSTVTSVPFSIRFQMQLEPGSATLLSVPATLASPPPVPYVFCVSGYRMDSLSDTPGTNTFKLPAGSTAFVSCGGNCYLIYLRPGAAPEPYKFAIDLPDRRHAEATFQHR